MARTYKKGDEVQLLIGGKGRRRVQGVVIEVFGRRVVVEVRGPSGEAPVTYTRSVALLDPA